MTEYTADVQHPQPKGDSVAVTNWKKLTRVIYYFLFQLEVPDGVGEFVELLVAYHKKGKFVNGWWIVYDAALAGFATDNPTDRDKTIRRLRNQRTALFEWQKIKGNPVLIEAEMTRDATSGQRAYKYRLPIAEAVDRAVEAGALFMDDGQLKQLLRSVGKERLKQSEIEQLPPDAAIKKQRTEIARSLSTLFNQTEKILEADGNERLKQVMYGTLASDLERPGMREALRELAEFYVEYCN